MAKYRAVLKTFIEGRHRNEDEEFALSPDRAAPYVDAGLIVPAGEGGKEAKAPEPAKKTAKPKD